MVHGDAYEEGGIGAEGFYMSCSNSGDLFRYCTIPNMYMYLLFSISDRCLLIVVSVL